MSDSISRALTLINDQLDKLHGLMTAEPLDEATARYRAWKSATRAVLSEIVVEPVVSRFDLARGAEDQGAGRRPIPPIFLHAAASRTCLITIRKDVEKDPAAVLRVPPPEPIPAHRLGRNQIIDLLERRLGKAFRGRPETEQDVQDGFETLLVATEIPYERGNDSIVHGSLTRVPDFAFPGLQTALKLKLCDRPDREEAILAEINEDIPAYRAKYTQVVFGVYDLGFIRDVDRFAQALTADDGVLVRVIEHR